MEPEAIIGEYISFLISPPNMLSKSLLHVQFSRVTHPNNYHQALQQFRSFFASSINFTISIIHRNTFSYSISQSIIRHFL